MMTLFVFSVLFEMVLGAAGAQSPLFVPVPGSPLAAAGGPGNILIGDINKDGKLDIAATNVESDTVTVLLSSGK